MGSTPCISWARAARASSLAWARLTDGYPPRPKSRLRPFRVNLKTQLREPQPVTIMPRPVTSPTNVIPRRRICDTASAPSAFSNGRSGSEGQESPDLSRFPAPKVAGAGGNERAGTAGPPGS